MRATSLKNGAIAVRDIPTPEPGPGQLLVRTLACGICASDHHYMDHPEVSRGDKSGMRVDAPECDMRIIGMAPDAPDANNMMPDGLTGTHALGYNDDRLVHTDDGWRTAHRHCVCSRYEDIGAH